MRYIRTTDGRIIDKYNPPIFYKMLDVVIKESDSIEELCDCFVTIMPPTFPHIHEYYSDMIDWVDNDWEDTTCYGAIWTDKGLIYVAKMNSKGELELL